MPNEKTIINKPKTTIGVSNYTFWVMEEDSKQSGTAKYGGAYTLPGTVEISPTDNGGTENFDADNGAYEVESYVEKMGHEITNADIPPEVDRMWRGLDSVEAGVNIKRDTFAKTPYCAVAWMIMKSDGSYRLVKYFKGKYGFASNIGGKTKKSEGAAEKQTAKATYSATFRDCDDNGYYYIDTNNLPEGVTEDEAVEKWFTEVDYFPTAVTTGE